jgi:outer membrane protein OmpA-like peptidoglycan-associated protein
MPRGTIRLALAARLTTAGLTTAGLGIAGLAMAGLSAGCTPPLASHPITFAPSRLPPDARFAQLASAIATDLPGTELLSAPAGLCGPAGAPVVRLVLPEPVLFATDSDQPGPAATAALDDIAGEITRDTPAAELTVLGHTDAIGSDAYNMDLSKRRAVAVLHALVGRGLDPARLSAVAIGERQPIADNATPEGRARNRRVELLISKCLAANLHVVAGVAPDRAFLAADADRPVEVMRLDPAGASGLALLATVALKPPEGDPPAALRTSSVTQPAATPPPSGVARPAPAPHYQRRTLPPAVQPNPLGPAVPF